MESELLAGLTVGLLAVGTAMLGSIGGLGGAVLLVPALVLLGWSPLEAAPIGIAMSAAAAGALLSVLLPVDAVQYALGGAAIAASLAGGLRRGQRNLPVEGADLAELRDQPGRLASAYPDEAGRVIPYQVARFKTGMGLIGGAGLLAGLTGLSGGFIKTPVMSEVMHVPVKVAAATTMFMIGVTAAVTIAVYTSQGRITAAIAPAALGGLMGGRIGAAVQPRLPAALVRRLLSATMFAIGIVLVVRA